MTQITTSENWIIQCSVSGGRSSGMLTHIMSQNYGPEDVIYTFANTGKEREETLEFIHEMETRWDLDIHWIEYTPEAPGFRVVDYETASRNGEPFEQLIRKKKYLPNGRDRFCTQDLKVVALDKFLLSLGYTNWDTALGFRYDEPLRVDKKKNDTRKETGDYLFPLYDLQVSSDDVLKFWKSQTFDLQIYSYQGNCDLCFYKGVKIKRQLLREDATTGAWWSQMEEEIGATFSSRHSINDLLTKVDSTPMLFSPEDSISGVDCICDVL